MLPKTLRRFPQRTITAIDTGKILGIRAGKGPHRFIGIWVVVVENRVFVRSWSSKPGGWYMTLLEDPQCTIKVGSRGIAARAVRTRSSRLKDAVSRAYREKYNTPGSLKYVQGFKLPKRKNTTSELVPA